MLLNRARDLGLTAPLLAIVDEDPLFLAVLAANLSAAGYRVVTFITAQTLLTELRGGFRPRAILLGTLPASHEILLSQAFNAEDVPGLIVRLTAGAPDLRGAGAALNIDRTLPPMVTVRHLQRLLAMPARSDGAFSLENLRLEMDWREAYWRNKPLRLRRADFAVVALLAARAGVTVAYRELYEAIRSDLLPDGRNGDTHRVLVRAAVERVRLRFTAQDPQFDAIAYDAGLGYRWRP
jgi:DNA-binding response OmpR family regulator